MRINFNKEEFNKLTNQLNNYILSNDIKIFILDNLKLLTKKNGDDFQDIKKAFDIESLKTILAQKYNCIWGNGSYILLSVSDYDFEIKFNIKNIKDTLYIKRRFYIDELKQEEREKISKDRILGGGILREYYYISSNKELKEAIQNTKQSLINYQNYYKEKLAKCEKLKDYVLEFIKNVNTLQKNDYSDFFHKEISNLIY